MATSHGLSMISAVTVASTPFAGMMVRPENAANAASTSRMSAFSQAIVMRGCCGCCGTVLSIVDTIVTVAGAVPGIFNGGAWGRFTGGVGANGVDGGGVSTGTRTLGTNEVASGAVDGIVSFVTNAGAVPASVTAAGADVGGATATAARSGVRLPARHAVKSPPPSTDTLISLPLRTIL